MENIEQHASTGALYYINLIRNAQEEGSITPELLANALDAIENEVATINSRKVLDGIDLYRASSGGYAIRYSLTSADGSGELEAHGGDIPVVSSRSSGVMSAEMFTQFINLLRFPEAIIAALRVEHPEVAERLEGLLAAQAAEILSETTNESDTTE